MVLGKNTNQCNSYGSNCHKKLPYIGISNNAWSSCRRRESIHVPGYILSMVLHIRENAMDLKEVQYLLFNGYE